MFNYIVYVVWNNIQKSDGLGFFLLLWNNTV